MTFILNIPCAVWTAPHVSRCLSIPLVAKLSWSWAGAEVSGCVGRVQHKEVRVLTPYPYIGLSPDTLSDKLTCLSPARQGGPLLLTLGGWSDVTWYYWDISICLVHVNGRVARKWVDRCDDCILLLSCRFPISLTRLETCTCLLFEDFLPFLTYLHNNNNNSNNIYTFPVWRPGVYSKLASHIEMARQSPEWRHWPTVFGYDQRYFSTSFGCQWLILRWLLALTAHPTPFPLATMAVRD